MLPDSALLDIARQMKREGTFQRVFYDGRTRTAEDFLEIMQRPANLPVLAFSGTEPIAVAWLNGLSGSQGFAHFCTMKSAWGRQSATACRLFLDYWMSLSSGGEPILDTILGVIQSTNRRAVKFVERLGFVRLGAIPQMLTDAYAGEKTDADILYYARVNHGRRR